MAIPMPDFTDEERGLLHLALLNEPGEGIVGGAHAATKLGVDGWLVEGPNGAEATQALRDAPWNTAIAPELVDPELVDPELVDDAIRRLLNDAD
jgi:hypothetical protein